MPRNIEGSSPAFSDLPCKFFQPLNDLIGPHAPSIYRKPRWGSGKFSMVELYVKGMAHFEIRHRAGEGSDHRITFSALPYREVDLELLTVGCSQRECLRKRGLRWSEGQSNAVFMRTRHLLKKFKPKLVSLVRVRPYLPENGVEGLGDPLALSGLLSGERVLKVVGGLSEGEVSAIGPLTRHDKGGRRHSLVKRIPNILDCVGSDSSKVLGNGLEELYLDLIESRICIEFSKDFVGVTFDKILSEPSKFKTVLVRSAN